MPNRTRPRTTKLPYGHGAARTVHHIPRTRRRDSQPIVLIVPERPTLTRRAATAAGMWFWEQRGTWAPTALALLAFVAVAIGHVLASWTGLLLAPVAALPLGWLVWTNRREPQADRSVRRWRRALALLTTTAIVWAACALAFGPTAGPLGLLWLVTAISAQVMWLRARRTSTDPIEETV
ncbi:hypothetical protein A8W25_18020 [Streptomyces sp. ERV7]|uniref:hypothetical protein n=1 Tax=Streptomyces sp. ERV7 TaxID=1322334 RepID=UPI0007F53C78|nr:hypothetical protein [Streptomyces sp. ERV7]OAR24316.1 hypothetical protein A8W25_18020 [Streptomyces sp. ERV7]